jgi:hypothetical protein
MNDAVEVLIQPGSGYVVALLVGVLSMQTMAAVRDVLVELLGESDCVVADLSGLRLRHPGCVVVFPAALELAGGWPQAKLALFGADPRMLAQLRSRRVGAAVPVADGLDAALAMAAQRPRPARASAISPTDEQGMSHVLAVAEKKGELTPFIRGWLGVLIDHDALQRSELVSTLSVYLDRGGDYGDASRALGVHRSTVRYRLQRIHELTRLDLHDADTRLNLHAATRALARLSGAP